MYKLSKIIIIKGSGYLVTVFRKTIPINKSSESGKFEM